VPFVVFFYFTSLKFLLLLLYYLASLSSRSKQTSKTEKEIQKGTDGAGGECPPENTCPSLKFLLYGGTSITQGIVRSTYKLGILGQGGRTVKAVDSRIIPYIL